MDLSHPLQSTRHCLKSLQYLRRYSTRIQPLPEGHAQNTFRIGDQYATILRLEVISNMLLLPVLKHGSVLFVLANPPSERSFKPITLQIGNTFVIIESLFLFYSFCSLIWPSKERDFVSMLSLLDGSFGNFDASNGKELGVEQRSFNSASLLLTSYDLSTVLKSVDMNSSSAPYMIYTHMFCGKPSLQFRQIHSDITSP